MGGIDDFDTRRDGHAAAGRQPMHATGVAHQHAAGDAALVADDRRLDGAWFVAFGQDNALVGPVSALHQHVAEGRRAESPFLDRGQ